MSTVTKAVTVSEGLDKWIKAVGEEHANKKRQQAADRGNNLHKLCEKYLRNESLQCDLMNPQYSMFKRVRKIIDEHIDDIHGVELPIISHKLKIAGTLDLLAHYDDRLTVIDWKNTQSRQSAVSKKLPKYFLQSTIYAMIVEEQFNIPVEQVAIVFGYVKDESQAFVIPITDKMKESVVSLVDNFRANYIQELERATHLF